MNNLLSDRDTETVYDILVEQLGVPKEQLVPDARLYQDCGADSLTLMEIAMALEERLNLSVPDQDWANVQTVIQVFETVSEAIMKRDQPHPRA